MQKWETQQKNVKKNRLINWKKNEETNNWVSIRTNWMVLQGEQT